MGTRRFAALGTTVTLAVTDPAVLAAAERALRSALDAIDRAASRFRADSDLAAVNAAAGHPVPVSAVMIDAVQAALRAARLSGGLVDPTVGTALRVLGYDRTFAAVAGDGPAVGVSVTAVPGWQVVRVDPERATVCVPAGVELDLGATAKARSADLAAADIAAWSGAGVLVELGGDVAVAGPPPPGGWPVLVTDRLDGPAGPAPDGDGGCAQTVSVVSGGLATSGLRARRWRRGGRELHHLVDPATGWPVDTPWRTVSTVAATCVDANIASTAAVIAGAGAPTWLASQRLAARLVDHAGRVRVLGGWPQPAAGVARPVGGGPQPHAGGGPEPHAGGWPERHPSATGAPARRAR